MVEPNYERRMARKVRYLKVVSKDKEAGRKKHIVNWCLFINNGKGKHNQ